MKIKIEYNGTVMILPSVHEAGLFLMELFKDRYDSEIMGRMTLDNLREYVKNYPVTVSRVDHSLRWKGV